MKNIKEIIALLHEAKPEWVRRFGVKRLSVFGSYVTGDQREDSDVDILVEVHPSIGLRFVDLAEEIEAVLGIQAEVVSRRAIKPRIGEVIEKELNDVL